MFIKFIDCEDMEVYVNSNLIAWVQEYSENSNWTYLAMAHHESNDITVKESVRSVISRIYAVEEMGRKLYVKEGE